MAFKGSFANFTNNFFSSQASSHQIFTTDNRQQIFRLLVNVLNDKNYAAKKPIWLNQIVAKLYRFTQKQFIDFEVNKEIFRQIKENNRSYYYSRNLKIENTPIIIANPEKKRIRDLLTLYERQLDMQIENYNNFYDNNVKFPEVVLNFYIFHSHLHYYPCIIIRDIDKLNRKVTKRVILYNPIDRLQDKINAITDIFNLSPVPQVSLCRKGRKIDFDYDHQMEIVPGNQTVSGQCAIMAVSFILNIRSIFYDCFGCFSSCNFNYFWDKVVNFINHTKAECNPISRNEIEYIFSLLSGRTIIFQNANKSFPNHIILHAELRRCISDNSKKVLLENSYDNIN
jgi:hypothetical protein